MEKAVNQYAIRNGAESKKQQLEKIGITEKQVTAVLLPTWYFTKTTGMY